MEGLCIVISLIGVIMVIPDIMMMMMMMMMIMIMTVMIIIKSYDEILTKVE